MRLAQSLFTLVLIVVSSTNSLWAQAPADTTPLYAGSFGGGLAVTGGNTETKNFNLAFSLVRDPKTRNVIKLNSLYFRGSQNDVLSVDRASVTARDEYTFSGRTFLFGQMEYLRDQFKDIHYLLAPIGGIGFKLADSDATKFALSGGAGGIWEKNPGLAVKSSGSLNAGQTFSQKLSDQATFTQSIATIWKTQDFSDYLTNFAVGLATSINGRLEVKVEFIDSYKNRPPTADVEKNDTAFLTTFVVKF
jgi:putative salt-induced outer membrane protein